jgi:hypothetical protein
MEVEVITLLSPPSPTLTELISASALLPIGFVLLVGIVRRYLFLFLLLLFLLLLNIGFFEFSKV